MVASEWFVWFRTVAVVQRVRIGLGLDVLHDPAHDHGLDLLELLQGRAVYIELDVLAIKVGYLLAPNAGKMIVLVSQIR